MKCPKCNKEMELLVTIEIRLPARYINLISKKAISKKECTITSTNWDKAKVTCYLCKYREVGV